MTSSHDLGIEGLLRRADDSRGIANLLAFDADDEPLGFVRLRDGKVVYAHVPERSARPELEVASDGTLRESQMERLLQRVADGNRHRFVDELEVPEEWSRSEVHFEHTLSALLELASRAQRLELVPRLRAEDLPYRLDTDALAAAVGARRYPGLVQMARAFAGSLTQVGDDLTWHAFAAHEPHTLCWVSRPGHRNATGYLRLARAVATQFRRADRVAPAPRCLWWKGAKGAIVAQREGELFVVFEVTGASGRVLLKRLLDRSVGGGSRTIRPVPPETSHSAVRRISQQMLAARPRHKPE